MPFSLLECLPHAIGMLPVCTIGEGQQNLFLCYNAHANSLQLSVPDAGTPTVGQRWLTWLPSLCFGLCVLVEHPLPEVYVPQSVAEMSRLSSCRYAYRYTRQCCVHLTLLHSGTRPRHVFCLGHFELGLVSDMLLVVHTWSRRQGLCGPLAWYLPRRAWCSDSALHDWLHCMTPMAHTWSRMQGPL